MVHLAGISLAPDAHEVTSKPHAAPLGGRVTRDSKGAREQKSSRRARSSPTPCADRRHARARDTQATHLVKSRASG